MRDGEIAALDNLERRHQFVFKEGLTAAIRGKCCHGANDGQVALLRAEVGFQRPDRDQNFSRNTKLLLQTRCKATVGSDPIAALGDHRSGNAAGIKLFRRQLERLLVAIQIDHRWIIGDARQPTVDRALRNASGARAPLKGLQPGPEGSGGVAAGLRMG